MNIKKYVFLLSTLLLIIVNQKINAQEKVDVSFEVLENKILINYTIDADPTKNYKVTVSLKRNSIPSFNYTPENISGSVGEGKFAGGKKTIVWNVSESEMEMFDGDDFYFEVLAVKADKKDSGFPWYYYAGAGVVAGAAVLLLSGSSGDGTSTPTTTSSIPDPPNRPIGNN